MLDERDGGPAPGRFPATAPRFGRYGSVGSAIRLLEPGTVYAVVQGTVDRAFAFAPNHDPAHPLLARGCPPEALDPASPIVPIPSVINIVGAAAARALALAPIDLHALELSSNHQHEAASARDGDVAALPAFWRDFHSKVARDLNRLRGREGHLYAGPTRVTPCADDDAALQQLVYALTNPVKDGLVDRVRRSPFFSTYRAQALGEPLRYFDIEWERWWAAGGPHNRRLHPKQFMVWRTLQITPLPRLAAMPAHERQALVRRAVAEVEAETAERFRREGRSFCPVTRHFATDPRERPPAPRDSGRKPLVHASTRAGRDAYREKVREVTRAYAPASVAFRAGCHEVEFPPGTFRPPLTRPIAFADSS